MDVRAWAAKALIGAWDVALHLLRGTPARPLRTSEIPALLDREDVLVLDTETTELGTLAEVIEVAIIDTTGALRLSALSMPSGRIWPDAVEIHGLTEARLRAMGARPWPAVHPELAAVLSGARHVLAYNADFDARVLKQTAARHRLPLPAVRWGDVRAAYTQARLGREYSLADAMRQEGLEWEGSQHRAEADCRPLLAVIRAIATA